MHRNQVWVSNSLITTPSLIFSSLPWMEMCAWTKKESKYKTRYFLLQYLCINQFCRTKTPNPKTAIKFFTRGLRTKSAASYYFDFLHLKIFYIIHKILISMLKHVFNETYKWNENLKFIFDFYFFSYHIFDKKNYVYWYILSIKDYSHVSTNSHTHILSCRWKRMKIYLLGFVNVYLCAVDWSIIIFMAFPM